MKKRLNSLFYRRNVVQVAEALIGKELVFGAHTGIITETEAYRGAPGYSYIYMIYGLHYCLNIVTEEISQPSAVLIRGLLLPNNVHLNGPGKICRYLGLNKSHNGLSLLDNDIFYIKPGIKVRGIIVTPRIGIKKAIDKPWRFLLQ